MGTQSIDANPGHTAPHKFPHISMFITIYYLGNLGVDFTVLLALSQLAENVVALGNILLVVVLLGQGDTVVLLVPLAERGGIDLIKCKIKGNRNKKRITCTMQPFTRVLVRRSSLLEALYTTSRIRHLLVFTKKDLSKKFQPQKR